MSDRTTSEIMSMIMVGYLANHCRGCPFYGIEEFEIDKICDSRPTNCAWSFLWQHFEAAEEDEEKAERKITMERITELDLIDLLVETLPAVAETLRTIATSAQSGQTMTCAVNNGKQGIITHERISIDGDHK